MSDFHSAEYRIELGRRLAEETEIDAGWALMGGRMRDLDSLAQSLGILVEDRPGGKPEAGSAARSSRSLSEDGYFVPGSRPKIVLMAMRGARTSRDRFTFAHEIGHYIVWKKTGAVPDESNYWLHEDICNAFASRLLVPPFEVRDFMEAFMGRRLLEGISLMSKEIGVSWAVAATVASEILGPKFVFFQVGCKGPWLVENLRVTFSSTQLMCGKQLGRGSALSPGLARKLMEIRQGRSSEWKIDEEVGSVLGYDSWLRAERREFLFNIMIKGGRSLIPLGELFQSFRAVV